MYGYGNSMFLATHGILAKSNAGTPPVNSVAPVISGSTSVGSTLTSTTGTWTGTAPITYTYQWYRGASQIVGATNSTYVLVSADVSNSIKCRVTATNAFGSANADSNSITATWESDAQAFITAASITDPTQQSAINQLVVDLKGYGVWTKMKALYPMVGGTSTSHSYNLRNTSQFQITWVGGVTHSANGVQYNGTNSYGNTNFNCDTNTTTTNNCVGAYSRTNGIGAGVSWGAVKNPGFQGLQLAIKYTDNNSYYGANDYVVTGSANVVSDTRGFFIVNRESLTSKRLYRNGTSVTSSDPSGNNGVLNGNLFIGARNLNGTADAYDNKQYAFTFVADTLTATEIGNLTTAVQAFQTTLGRSIGTQSVSDADAQAFVTNAGIVDQVEANAVNNLVIGLKADGLWTSARAIYPFIGGTSSTHKWNLRNPLDTNSAFRLTFGGGITHSSSGIKGNSLNGYYETYLNPSTEFSLATGGCGFVSINENLDTNTDFGAFESGVNYRFQLWIKSSNTTYASMLSNSLYSASNTASTIGFYGVTRQPNDNTNFYYIKDSTNIATAGAYQEPNSTINGFAFNINNGLRQSWGERRQSFAYYGEGLTTAQAQLLRARVNTFNTTLGR